MGLVRTHVLFVLDGDRRLVTIAWGELYREDAEPSPMFYS
jgi:hypothetical protein